MPFTASGVPFFSTVPLVGTVASVYTISDAVLSTSATSSSLFVIALVAPSMIESGWFFDSDGASFRGVIVMSNVSPVVALDGSNTWKSNERTLSIETLTLGADGNTLIVTNTGTKPNGEPIDDSTTFQRVTGGSGLEGRWVSTSVNLGLIPMTGIPLPLFSTGGSSLLTSFLAIGLAVGLAAHSEPALDKDAFQA